ncbi:TatD family hydrolase [Nanoarchaeota archaeon]
MIDSHAHLEQKDYEKDLDKLIPEWKKKLKKVITCCACPSDWERTKEIVKKNKKFVFAIAGVHPIYVSEVKVEKSKPLSTKDVEKFIEVLKKEAKDVNLVGLGEVGLDYHWVKDEKLRERQKEWFVMFIELAKEMDLPIIIHSWEAYSECIDVLEEHGMKGKKVLLHQYGENKEVERIIKNNWMVSIGPNILRSKKVKKIARDLPLKQILLETDSPWFGDGERGTPLNVYKAANKIAEVKGISVKEVEEQTDLNSIRFFSLDK